MSLQLGRRSEDLDGASSRRFRKESLDESCCMIFCVSLTSVKAKRERLLGIPTKSNLWIDTDHMGMMQEAEHKSQRISAKGRRVTSDGKGLEAGDGR